MAAWPSPPPAPTPPSTQSLSDSRWVDDPPDTPSRRRSASGHRRWPRPWPQAWPALWLGTWPHQHRLSILLTATLLSGGLGLLWLQRLTGSDLSPLDLGHWGQGLLMQALLLVALMVLLMQPGLTSLLYALLASTLAGLLALNLADGLASGTGLQAPAGAVSGSALTALVEALAAGLWWQMAWRLYARNGPERPWTVRLVWALTALVGLGTAGDLSPAATPTLWWLLCAASAAVLAHGARSQGRAPTAKHGLGWALAGIALLALRSLALAWPQAGVGPGLAPLALSGLAALVALAPLPAWPHHARRELVVVLAAALPAPLLQLGLASGTELGGTAAWALALSLSAVLLAFLRPAIASHLAGAGTLSAERLFDSLYRGARALEQSPHRASEHVANLLREVFDPLEVTRNRRPLSRVRVARDGSAMAVPVPDLGAHDHPARSRRTVLLRHARRGQRSFTDEDRELTERILEQLGRAMAFDRAVERGRAEERTRIAQDLHDDIGARLLTLMYKAPNSEIEEYIRHTLQDLKTLTRGLAAANPRLAHAAAEWKADISQRLHPTGCDLRWSFTATRDVTLNVVQWSGLTRVMRELVNNILAHAQASLVEIALQYDGEWLSLQVVDDGIGRAPGQWSHGLGLGGVRKRVKQLDGQVQWSESPPRGIRCDIRVRLPGSGTDLDDTPGR